MCVGVGGLTIWFSYQTPVAFQDDGKIVFCRRNDWGPTTGKHLNAIQPDHKKRIFSNDFEEQLAEVMRRHNLES